MLCSYGCGQIGKFKLKNGKLCCEYIFTKCPHIRLKNSLGNIGKEFSKERRSRISKSNKGKKHTEESRKRMSDSKIGKDPWNKGKHGYLSEESKQKLILGLKGKKRTPQQVINIKNALTGKKKSDEHRKNISESRKGKFCGSDNPFYGKHHSSETINKMKNHPNRISFYKEHREWMINGGAAYLNKFIKNPSKPQVKLYELIASIYSNSILNFPVEEVNRCIDIAIPEHMIAIEYDGSYWHQNEDSDKKRQDDLENLGWKFIRYRDYIPSMEELMRDIKCKI